MSMKDKIDSAIQNLLTQLNDPDLSGHQNTMTTAETILVLKKIQTQTAIQEAVASITKDIIAHAKEQITPDLLRELLPYLPQILTMGKKR